MKQVYTCHFNKQSKANNQCYFMVALYNSLPLCVLSKAEFRPHARTQVSLCTCMYVQSLSNVSHYLIFVTHVQLRSPSSAILGSLFISDLTVTLKELEFSGNYLMVQASKGRIFVIPQSALDILNGLPLFTIVWILSLDNLDILFCIFSKLFELLC